MTKWNQICNLRVNSAFLVVLLLIFGQSITDDLFSAAIFIRLHHSFQLVSTNSTLEIVQTQN
jgi:hypothetical protein